MGEQKGVQQELERAENNRRSEVQRAAADARRRQTKVAAYLKDHGFKGGVTGQKWLLFKTTYPLHAAAKSGNTLMVGYLLKEGADATQKDSSGRTAAEVAQRRNRSNSHAGALRLLAASTSQSAAG